MKITLLCLVVLSLLAAGGVAADQPSPTPFAAQKSPPPPDYGKPESWAVRPGGAASGAAAAVAPGATDPVQSSAIDVFYVHPTTDRSMERWNQDVSDNTVNRWTDASVIARQASIFNGCCRVFAPRYRQATLLALFNMPGDGDKAFDLAYGDVERAFETYLANDNHGRPFILVGHSQGAFHLARLLERQIDGTPLAGRMVAAYIVGLNLSEGEFGKTYKTILICERPDQIGCVVGWNSVLPEVNREAIAAASERRYVSRYGDDPGKTILCVNPLTFDRAQPAANADHSQGAEPGAPDAGPLRPLRPHSVSARCQDGWLVVEPAPDLGLKSLPGGSMHYHDLGLFYADVRANARLRAAAFLRATGGR